VTSQEVKVVWIVHTGGSRRGDSNLRSKEIFGGVETVA
jgi:hypothetical protein